MNRSLDGLLNLCWAQECTVEEAMKIAERAGFETTEEVVAARFIELDEGYAKFVRTTTQFQKRL